MKNVFLKKGEMMRLRYLIYVCLSVFCGMLSYGHAASQSDPMHFHSQASQDEFVYTVLCKLFNKQDKGYYLEIGSGHPIQNNNSYFFEKNLGWEGVSIDITDHSKVWYAARNNLLRVEDALQTDYVSLLQSFPKVIDYLSLDIDTHYDTVLQRIPLNDHIFKVITIEHDFYRFGDVYREKEREILTSFGYHLLCADVSFIGFTFEDWWVHPSAFSDAEFSQITLLDLNGKDDKYIIAALNSLLEEK